MTPASILMRYRSWRGLRLQWHRPPSTTPAAVRMMAVVVIAAVPRIWRTGLIIVGQLSILLAPHAPSIAPRG